MFWRKEHSESLVLVMAPGVLRKENNSEIPSPFVVGIQCIGKAAVYHYQIDQIGNTTTSTIELASKKAQKVQELFRKLYSPERDTREFDCLSGLDFMIGAHADIKLREHNYNISGPVTSENLERGEPYVVVAEGSASHGMLATDTNHVLHVAGPQGGMGYAPTSDILQVWPGELYRVTAAR